jgi:hypothetical protein
MKCFLFSLPSVNVGVVGGEGNISRKCELELTGSGYDSLSQGVSGEGYEVSGFMYFLGLPVNTVINQFYRYLRLFYVSL